MPILEPFRAFYAGANSASAGPHAADGLSLSRLRPDISSCGGGGQQWRSSGPPRAEASISGNQYGVPHTGRGRALAASALCPNLEPAIITSALFNLFGRITTETYTLE